MNGDEDEDAASAEGGPTRTEAVSRGARRRGKSVTGRSVTRCPEIDKIRSPREALQDSVQSVCRSGQSGRVWLPRLALA